MSNSPEDIRSVRLRRLLADVNYGKRTIKNKADAKLYLEAICDQNDKSDCIEKLAGSTAGLAALKRSLRVDVSVDFINNSSGTFINYVADDAVRQLGNGQPLRDILMAIAQPPLFWNAFQTAYTTKSLSSVAVRAFACLVSDLLTASSQISDLDMPELLDVADATLRPGGLLDSSDPTTRMIAYKIQDCIRSRKTSGAWKTADIPKPGGRHDNDFEDFRQVAVFPTRDEFLTTDQPFYLPSSVVFELPPEDRASAHLDNQFRLLREDMLAELRTDISKAPRKYGKRAALRVNDLALKGVSCGDTQRRKPATIALECLNGFPGVKLNKMDKAKRLQYFKDNKNVLKHQSFGCLLASGDIVAFATVHRDDNLLSLDKPVVLLQVFGEAALENALVSLRTNSSKELEFAQVDTPYFAYEPVLKRLQELPLLPISGSILGLSDNNPASSSIGALEELASTVRDMEGQNIRKVLRLPKDVCLDRSQTESLVTGLTQSLSLIQGPPGTGKSFLGAILAKALLDNTKESILVLCYTNHALDQFLEDILNMGVAERNIVRLGSKSTPATKSLGMFEQSANFRRSKNSWANLNRHRNATDECASKIQSQVAAYLGLKASDKDILEYLTFSNDDYKFYEAFVVPDDDDGMKKVGKKNKVVDSTYLISRWRQGHDAGVLKSVIDERYQKIWQMDKASRSSTYQRWKKAFFNEQAAMLSQSMAEYRRCFEHYDSIENERRTSTIQSKRIIGCTTTGAAMYSNLLSSAQPGIVLVEEAGEILESHVLTALSPDTKQVILIGDHQQLRPKVNNFDLTIEKGDGYDLNRSLFERLVIQGYPHVTLTKQHRMRPEISALVRRMTYPDLQDDAKTQNRSNLRGFQSNVVFLNHHHPETSIEKIADLRDENSVTSRENLFEVEMVLKTVRYLAQQGYGTEKQVVLTPYLGQLRLLLEHLRVDHDPVLNDLDSFDLVRAGLLPSASASMAKQTLKVSTIDNYQGEESEVVIVSLTRGNAAGDIGFMSQAQRLNVLLSRARNGLIIIGNAGTFERSRKGQLVWQPFLEQLAEAGQIYDGLPVKCERHPHKVALLKTAGDFDIHCPEGGCSEPCDAVLNCGKHTCPQKCHQIVDHSKTPCQFVLEDRCPKGHKKTWECWEQSKQCATCEREIKKLEAQRKRDRELDAMRQAQERAYLSRLAELDDEISHELRLQKESNTQQQRQAILDQRRKDLDQVRANTTGVTINVAQNQNLAPVSTVQEPQVVTATVANEPDQSSLADAKPVQPSQTPNKIESPSSKEWDYQKACECASNEHLDTLMCMIGLESVKEQFLTIKAKIDTSLRQGVSLQTDRFGAVLLGNPGTGKTTVARLYAQFLASVGVLSGTTVKETTAARLAADGVNGFKSLVDDVLNSGGGAIFIDEAYQLASGSNFGGSQILDFLLPEVENLTGKVVFILAGYRKQMETFFAHNPGLSSRFPHELQFHDYKDDELLEILGYQINKFFKGRMQVEGGLDGLYCRIAARRVGYGRGREGFGNARALENTFAKIRDRQSRRLRQERRDGLQPDDMVLTKVDLIGPEPAQALADNVTWKKLQSMTGLDAVKQSVKALLETIQYNYQRELEEKPLLEFNLNKVFLGSPGTGKTTVAKLYGQILVDIGLLSNGEVVVKNPSDFVGDVLGASEKTTKGILASTVGKVLVIDEAYALHSGSMSKGDPFKTAVIDTIVAEVQSVPGDDRCVLLIGYKDQMEEMFQSVNPGLSRRFPLADAFNFEDFTNDQLEIILMVKLEQQGYEATDQAVKVALEVLDRARNRPNFGNAGEVDILLNSAKSLHQQRRTQGKVKGLSLLEAVDMDPQFDRSERAATNIGKLFEGVIGCEEFVVKFEGYQRTAANMKARGMEAREHIPFNMLFRGPPGTGKTTTARKMGKIYYDMGFLATAEVIETSATDLIGEYIGQTGPKTQRLLQKALGKVLFIDEAYRLAEGHFAKEAMDELVDCLTKPQFDRRLIVILAGYDSDINRLMLQNPGLTSRFPDALSFRSLNPPECLDLFISRLRRSTKKIKVDISMLEDQNSVLVESVLNKFDTLIKTANWANGRDVNYLAKSVFAQVMRDLNTSEEKPSLDSSIVLQTMDSMIGERSGRELDAIAGATGPVSRIQAAPPPDQPIGPMKYNTETTVIRNSSTEAKSSQEQQPLPSQAVEQVLPDVRDHGVSDEIWTSLENDKRAALFREASYQTLVKAKSQLQAINTRLSLDENEQLDKHCDSLKQLDAQPSTTESTEKEDARRFYEQERIRSELTRRQRAEELERLKKEQLEKQLEKEKEQKAQEKLRTMGVCVMGYRWIKQANGYRCAGGSHFVSNSQLE